MNFVQCYLKGYIIEVTDAQHLFRTEDYSRRLITDQARIRPGHLSTKWLGLSTRWFMTNFKIAQTETVIACFNMQKWISNNIHRAVTVY